MATTSMVVEDVNSNGDIPRTQRAAEILNKVLGIVETKPRAIVDDTSIEKVLSLLDNLATNRKHLKDVLLDTNVNILPFLKSKTVRQDDFSFGFALRLSAIIASRSEDFFSTGDSEDNVRILLLEARGEILRSISGKRVHLHSALLRALKSLIPLPCPRQWIQETGLLDVSTKAYLSSSYYVTKEAAEVFALYLKHMNGSVPDTVLQEIKEQNSNDFVYFHLCVVENLLSLSAKAATMYLRETCLFDQFFTQREKSEQLPRNVITKSFEVLEMFIQSFSDFVAMVPVPNQQELSILLEQFLQLLIQVGKQDMKTAVEHLPFLALPMHSALEINLKEWNSYLLQCQHQMLRNFVCISQIWVPDISNKDRMQIQTFLICFEEEVKRLKNSASSSAVPSLLNCLLQSIGNMIQKIQVDSVGDAILSTINEMVVDVLKLIPELRLRISGTGLRPLLLGISIKSKERCLAKCLDVIAIIVNSPMLAGLKHETVLQVWNQVVCIFRTLRDSKVFQASKKVLSSLLKTVFSKDSHRIGMEANVQRCSDVTETACRCAKDLAVIFLIAIQENHWAVRDSAIEFTSDFLEFLRDNAPGQIPELILNDESWIQYMTALWSVFEDFASYVRASFLIFLTKMQTCVFFKHILALWGINEGQMLKICSSIIESEREAFPRRAAVDFYKEWIKNRVFFKDDNNVNCSDCKERLGITFEYKDEIMHVLHMSLIDFDWEVRLSGVSCLELLLTLIQKCPKIRETSSRLGHWQFEKTGSLMVDNTANSAQDERLSNGNNSLQLVNRLHVLSNGRMKDCLINAVNDYDCQVQKMGLQVVSQLQILIRKDKTLASRQNTSSLKTTSGLPQGFVPCPQLEELLTAVMDVDVNSIQSMCDIEQETDVLEELCTFLQDVVAASEQTADNLLDCY